MVRIVEEKGETEQEQEKEEQEQQGGKTQTFQLNDFISSSSGLKEKLKNDLWATRK